MSLQAFSGLIEALPGGYANLSVEELRQEMRLIDFAVTNGRRLHEQLWQLAHKGPVWDGDVICKGDRTELLEIGAAAKVLCNGEYGFQSCTYLGGRLLRLIETIYPEVVARRTHS